MQKEVVELDKAMLKGVTESMRGTLMAAHATAGMLAELPSTQATKMALRMVRVTEGCMRSAIAAVDMQRKVQLQKPPESHVVAKEAAVLNKKPRKRRRKRKVATVAVSAANNSIDSPTLTGSGVANMSAEPVAGAAAEGEAFPASMMVEGEEVPNTEPGDHDAHKGASSVATRNDAEFPTAMESLKANWVAELPAAQKEALLKVMNSPGLTKDDREVILAEVYKDAMRRRDDAS